MKTRSFLLIFATLAFHGCTNAGSVRDRMNRTLVGGNPKPISLDELQSLAAGKPLKARTLSVNFTGLKALGTTITFPVTMRPGQKTMIEIIREFRYPSTFDFPTANEAKGTLTPTTPTEFENRDTGLTIEFTPTLHGPFVVLKGTVTERVFEGFTQNAGDVFRPVATRNGILISPNRVQTPMFTTRETPFFAALQPGKPESFFVNTKDGPQRITVKCDVVR